MTYHKTRFRWGAAITATMGLFLLMGLLSVRWYPAPGPVPVYHAGTLTVRRDTTPAPDHIAGLDAWEQTRASLLLLRNTHTVLPFGSLSDRRFRLVVLGEALPVFARTLDAYTQIPVRQVHSLRDLSIADLSMDHQVILAINTWHGDTSLLRPWTEALAARTEVVVVNFGDYAYLEPLRSLPTLMQVPGSDSLSQALAAQALFGGVAVTRQTLPRELAAWLNQEALSTIAWPCGRR